ncbi:MAG: S9 family peptidase [Planctomycetes bacterium]|nr:S9 family peptidase [Planctomycetota bacterium]
MRPLALLISLMLNAAPLQADDKKAFEPMDVFRLEFAADPQISPDGDRVVYVRTFMDIQKDRRRSDLWIINVDGSNHRALTNGEGSHQMPRWSPDGKRLVYLSTHDGATQLMCRWLDNNQSGLLAKLPAEPLGMSWSPDGKSLAFTMFAVETPKPFVTLPTPPKGAEWAKPPIMIRSLDYRFDGKGYLKDGHSHLFVVPADGGTPRQLTSGKFNHIGVPAWTPDGNFLLVTGNRHPEGEYDPLNTEIYEVALKDGATKALTSRQGPDISPTVSPDGKKIAFVGLDDKRQGHQVAHLHVMNRDGSEPRAVTTKLDRDVKSPVWNSGSSGVFFQYDDKGDTKIGSTTLEGNSITLASGVGGTTLDRPYASGSFSATPAGAIALTMTETGFPAEVAVRPASEEKRGLRKPTRLTRITDSLLANKKLATVEEIRYKSKFDKQEIHGWVVKPPDFDAKKKYPLILEIHGGPFANYGPRFAVQMQLYAAAGYVVLYTNPRGSTSYGTEFGNLIHHAYPGHDYDDLMSGVDAVLEKGYVDPDNLFVTGGSGGGVLTAWIIGKTGRFRAAVVGKPVINWYSFVLTSDIYSFFTRNWFPGPPWEHVEHYLKRSPISLVGNVNTPTMILTGEDDHRTPMSESEQLYQALKLRKIDTALVRVPGASHDIAARPSHQIAQMAYAIQWFETHRKK